MVGGCVEPYARQRNNLGMGRKCYQDASRDRMDPLHYLV